MYRMKAFCPECNNEVSSYDDGMNFCCPECNNVAELLEDHCDYCKEIFANDELNENGNCEDCQYVINEIDQEYLSSIRADYWGSR